MITSNEAPAWAGKAVSLTFEKVSKSYGSRRVLRDFSLKVSSGEAIAITGANGSGKSTLLRIAAGLLRATRGEVAITVGSETRQTGGERRFWVGFASPDLALYPELTGKENLAFFATLRGDPQRDCDADLAAVGLSGRGNDRVSAYSSGMRQRLRLAFAMAGKPPLLLLDEPSLALDAPGVQLVERMVRAHCECGGMALIATNDPREAALGDRAVAVTG